MVRHSPDGSANARVANGNAPTAPLLQRKDRFTLSRALILLAVISASATGCGADSTSTPKTGGDSGASGPVQPSKPTTAAPSPTGPTAKLPVQSDDWRLDSVRVNDDGQGDFAGTAQVTYTGGDPQGGTSFFTLRVFARGKGVAALLGGANRVPPGRPVTLRLVSQERFVKGPYRYEFQNGP